MDNKGKLTFTGIIVIFLVLYGAFSAVQIISAKLTESEIAKKVKDRLGRERRFSLTDAEAEDFIYEILSKQRGIVFGEAEEDTISVTIDHDTRLLSYYFEYGMDTNFVFFKKSKRVIVEDAIKSYR